MNIKVTSTQAVAFATAQETLQIEFGAMPQLSGFEIRKLSKSNSKQLFFEVRSPVMYVPGRCGELFRIRCEVELITSPDGGAYAHTLKGDNEFKKKGWQVLHSHLVATPLGLEGNRLIPLHEETYEKDFTITEFDFDDSGVKYERKLITAFSTHFDLPE